jgi:hypothetical protein
MHLALGLSCWKRSLVVLRWNPIRVIVFYCLKVKDYYYNVKYLGVIFDKRVTLTLHIEMVEAKALRIFVRVYSLFKSERLRTNIKLTLHKALIRSIMTYASPTCEFAAENHLLKL